jgi:hypothetical protein
MYDMEGIIDSSILKKVAAILRKRAVELNPSNNDSESRYIFESFTGFSNWNKKI